MPKPNLTVLLSAHDPGAANFLAPVAKKLSEQVKLTIVLSPLAQSVFDRYGLKGLCAQDQSALGWLEQVKPDYVVTGTSEGIDTLDRQLVLEAKLKAIPVMSVVDFWSQYAKRFSDAEGTQLAYLPDTVCVVDEQMRAALSEIGISDSQIAITGHPHLEQLPQRFGQTPGKRAELFEKLGFDRHFPLICFVSETFGWNVQSDYRFHSNSGYQERTLLLLENCLQAVADIADESGMLLQVVNKLHPKNKMQEFFAFESAYPLVHAQDIDPYQLIQAADVVVGMTSMLLLEAACLGTETLSLVPREAEEKMIPNAKDNWRVVRSSKELKEELKRVLNTQSTEQSLRKDLPEAHLGATDRVIHHIMQGERVVSC